MRPPAIAGTSGRVPSRFEAAVTATRRVRSDSTAARSSQLGGLRVEVEPAHGGAGRARRPAPRAGCWRRGRAGSRRPRRPDPSRLASVRARSKVSWVIDRPKTTPPGRRRAGRRSPHGRRATTSSAWRSASVTVPGWRAGRHRARRPPRRPGRHLRAARPVEVGHPVGERAGTGSGCARDPCGQRVRRWWIGGAYGGDRFTGNPVKTMFSA